MYKKREIGSEFHLETQKNEKSFLSYFRSCRDALFYLSGFHNNENVLLPAYSCESMIRSFVSNDCKIFYYGVNRRLSINESEIERIVDEKNIRVLMIINYFGVNTFSDLFIKKLKESFPKLLVIEDKTQNIYDYPLLRENVDFTVASYRKWFNIPDGGILVSRYLINPNYENDCDYAMLKKKTMERKAVYIETGLEDKTLFLKEFQTENSMLDQLGVYNISEYSFNVINRLDYNLYRTIRKSNFEALEANINKANCHPLTNNTNSLYFPVLIKHRNVIKEKLAKKGIYCPVIWEVNDNMKFLFPEVAHLSDNILAIPCDHRYTYRDMMFVCENLNEIIKELED